MAKLNFDASTVAPNTGTMDAIPAGWYNTQIDQSELRPTKDGSGAYLELRFAVLDGQYVGRKVFARLNLRNNNPQAVEIAYKDLSAICHAIGIMQVQDSSQLHGVPLKIKVSVRAATGEYEASNDIKAYKNINEQVGGPGSMPAAGGSPWGAPAAAQPQQPAWAPQAAAAPVAPAAHFAPPQPPAAQQAAAPAWQPPAAAQPWAAAPQQAPAAPAQTAPQFAPQQFQQPAQQQPVAQPQQPAPQAPAQPAPGAAPAWMANVAPGGATPPWATPAQ